MMSYKPLVTQSQKEQGRKAKDSDDFESSSFQGELWQLLQVYEDLQRKQRNNDNDKDSDDIQGSTLAV